MLKIITYLFKNVFVIYFKHKVSVIIFIVLIKCVQKYKQISVYYNSYIFRHVLQSNVLSNTDHLLYLNLLILYHFIIILIKFQSYYYIIYTTINVILCYVLVFIIFAYDYNIIKKSTF